MPLTVTMVERAIKDLQYRFDANKGAKQQVRGCRPSCQLLPAAAHNASLGQTQFGFRPVTLMELLQPLGLSP